MIPPIGSAVFFASQMCLGRRVKTKMWSREVIVVVLPCMFPGLLQYSTPAPEANWLPHRQYAFAEGAQAATDHRLTPKAREIKSTTGASQHRPGRMCLALVPSQVPFPARSGLDGAAPPTPAGQGTVTQTAHTRQQLPEPTRSPPVLWGRFSPKPSRRVQHAQGTRSCDPEETTAPERPRRLEGAHVAVFPRQARPSATRAAHVVPMSAGV